METSLPLDPTDQEVSEYVRSLVDEVDAELRSDRWVILTGTRSGIVRLYAGALLWHCCELLRDIHAAIEGEREMATRILHRAFHEAWMMGLYIQYGGEEAVKAVVADMKATHLAQKRDAADYNAQLKKERKEARRIRRVNKSTEQWNLEHPDLPPRSLLTEVPEPQRPPLDLSIPALDRFGEIEAHSLNVQEVTRRLNRLGKNIEVGGDEHFGVVYTVGYRTLSSIGPHPNLEVIESYVDPGVLGNFVRVESNVRTPSAADLARHLSLQQTAHLSYRVLHPVPGANLPVTLEILARYLSMGGGGDASRVVTS